MPYMAAASRITRDVLSKSAKKKRVFSCKIALRAVGYSFIEMTTLLVNCALFPVVCLVSGTER